MNVFVKPESGYYSRIENGRAYMKVRAYAENLYLFKMKERGSIFASKGPIDRGKVLANELAEGSYDLSDYLWVEESDCIVDGLSTNASAAILLRR